MHIKKNTQSVLDIIIADHNLLFFWFVTCLFKNFHKFGSLGNVKISSNQLRHKRRYQETFWGLMRAQNGNKKAHFDNDERNPNPITSSLLFNLFYSFFFHEMYISLFESNNQLRTNKWKKIRDNLLFFFYAVIIFPHEKLIFSRSYWF